MPQFFVDKAFEVGEQAQIRGADARHIVQALRLNVGDWIVLSDGEGLSFRAIIEGAAPSVVRVRIEEQLSARSGGPAPALALALIPPARFEWALEKTVELGCRRILPFRSARTVPQRDAATGERRLARWRRIALEAAKQSGLPFRPDVLPVAAFSDLFVPGTPFRRIVLFYEGEQRADVHSFWKQRGHEPSEELVVIGPEGGFTDTEVALARQAGAATLALGPQILRVETAAIAALTLWQYEAGNMDAPSTR